MGASIIVISNVSQNLLIAIFFSRVQVDVAQCCQLFHQTDVYD